MDNLEINKNNWNLKINLNGGRIEELKYGEEIILGTFERIDGKTANTHICTPNFGDEGMEQFDLPFHGPFRNGRWDLVAKTDDEIEIELIINDLKVRQFFELKDSFSQKILIENLSQTPKRVNVAIHNYWEAKSGWENTKLNGKVVDKLVMSDVSQIVGEENILEIPGKSIKKWNIFGFKYGQFWTGFKEESGKKNYDQKYVCIEPALEQQGFLDNGENNLKANGKIEVGQEIGVVYRT